MIGFQPYETFQLLIETGGVERANTLLVAACEAFARRPRPQSAELSQFEALATRLFPTAAPSARDRAAQALGKADYLSPVLERLVFQNIKEGLPEYLGTARSISEPVLMEILDKRNVELCARIAARTDLSTLTLSKLFPINSRAVYRALASNSAIRFRGPYLKAITRAAMMDGQVAKTLAARKDIDKALLAPAFFQLDEDSRLDVIAAFGDRQLPETPLSRTFEHISVVTSEFTQALMKLFSENRRPEVTRLFTQITGLDEVRCGEIAHDTTGAALFVILRAFGCDAQDGMKVLLHATSHEVNRSRIINEYARLFSSLSVRSMVFMLSVWRGDVDLNELSKPEFQPVTQTTSRTVAAQAENNRESAVSRAVAAVRRLASNG
ncbi:DUF2336 domain-containing protein [Cucumibacter marinus]|uniref:DUF2336 domain-containing protein n=1 Tax=Cucumibacter marinus TaxID=1121252 RepID=UPI0003FEE01B|nr:DUF2336 domain-containing protein [Cucumibacter marinus]